MGFDTILVANRGEIALRIIATARRLGYRTVAVFSEADRDAPHVRAADRAICIGPAPSACSYLDGARIIAAARRTGAGAVHPGYGFLSENADFAADCATAGLVFIGPDPEAIRIMGDKGQARQAMQAAGVACVPGHAGADQDPARLAEAAGALGYPVMIKAAAGGGGKGMRLVSRAEDFALALEQARSEARSAFGADHMLLERAIVAPRHVEIQVFADRQGNVIHLGERDCSVQRRHQKLLEEAPAPGLSAALRSRMGAMAVRAAQAIGYVGAGTVEFLLDGAEDFYFLEMNTRLQVEHAVTEMVTGCDLVAWQIAIAEGQALPLAQQDLELDGWAIEARLYAEDPGRDFLPTGGTVLRLDLPRGAGLRCDMGIARTSRITPHYDPMLGKLIAHGQSREQARRRLLAALRALVLFGPVTNQGFLMRALAHEDFVNGAVSTDFVARHLSGAARENARPPELVALAAALLFVSVAVPAPPRLSRPAHYLLAADAGDAAASDAAGDGAAAATVSRTGAGLRVDMGAQNYLFENVTFDGQHWRATLNCEQLSGAALVQGGTEIWLAHDAARLHLRDRLGCAESAAASGTGGQVVAPMHGRVVTLYCQAGAAVSAEQPVLVLEAMKMQHTLCAQSDGVVTALHVRAGDQVAAGQLLAEIEPQVTS